MDIQINKKSNLPASPTPAGRLRLVVQVQRADSDVWTPVTVHAESVSGALLDALAVPNSVRIHSTRAPSPPCLGNLIELDADTAIPVVPNSVRIHSTRAPSPPRPDSLLELGADTARPATAKKDESALEKLLSSKAFKHKVAEAVGLVGDIATDFQTTVTQYSRGCGDGCYHVWDVAPACGYSRFNGISIDLGDKLHTSDPAPGNSGLGAVHEPTNLGACREVLAKKFSGDQLEAFMRFLTVVKADGLLRKALAEVGKQVQAAYDETAATVKAATRGANQRVRQQFLDSHPRLQALGREIARIKELSAQIPGAWASQPTYEAPSLL